MMEMTEETDQNAGQSNQGFDHTEEDHDERKRSMVEDDRKESQASIALADIMEAKRKAGVKISKTEIFSYREIKRNESARTCRSAAERITKTGKITCMQPLFQDAEFSGALFNLFDHDNSGTVETKDFIEMMRTNTSGPKFKHLTQERRHGIFEMIENAAYIICGEDAINSEGFYKILNSRGIREQLFTLADKDNDGELSINEVMAFLVVITKPRYTDDFDQESVKLLEETFKENLPPGKDELTLNEFKKIMPSKNVFFVERVFSIFDVDGDGTISLPEFLEKMNQYANMKSDVEKVLFLFKVYDIDGDGLLQEVELVRIMAECLKENGMKIPESDIDELGAALYDEALGDEKDTGSITIDQLTKVLAKHDGLLNNLTVSLKKFMVPQKKKAPPTKWDEIKAWYDRKLSWTHMKQNYQLFSFFGGFILINLILWIQRAAYFGGMANLDGTIPNPFYMLSRANGRTLLFNSTLIIICVLRYSITKLRDLGLSKILPLDNNIYIHKVIGIVIFFQAWSHTICHLINFGVNVQPDPVKFVQMNNDYWHRPYWTLSAEDAHKSNWELLGYNPIEGCPILSGDACKIDDDTNLLKAKYNPELFNITVCQVCDENSAPYSYAEWIFTSKPGVFGLIKGCANPTGVALICILTTMVICSMPFVRRSGNFQVFFLTHLLYYAYIILLILHAPDFWKWCIFPMVIFILEKTYRGLSTLVGVGKSYIADATVLASRVTRLTIKRPDGFKYSPGDWLFVRIPQIATYEWHPFTISSAPEDHDYITLHIRGVGHWTNRLYDYAEKQKKEEGLSTRASKRTKKNFSKKKSKEDLNAAAKNVEDQNNGQVVRYGDGKDKFDLVVTNGKDGHKKSALTQSISLVGRPLNLHKEDCLEIHLDGPFGAPASNIFRAEHAVLVATGIGVTPFSSILQSIIFRYKAAQRVCPNCNYKWVMDLSNWMQQLKKVDFFWINRDQNSFEWFLKLLLEIENEQSEIESSSQQVCPEDKNLQGDGRFMNIHLYFTQALQSSDIRAVGMQLAMDLLRTKSGGKDLMTGLKSKTNAGRPNWEKIFRKIQNENKGRVTVFYCGNPAVAKILRQKCEEFDFDFRKEVF